MRWECVCADSTVGQGAGGKDTNSLSLTHKTYHTHTHTRTHTQSRTKEREGAKSRARERECSRARTTMHHARAHIHPHTRTLREQIVDMRANAHTRIYIETRFTKLNEFPKQSFVVDRANLLCKKLCIIWKFELFRIVVRVDARVLYYIYTTHAYIFIHVHAHILCDMTLYTDTCAVY